MPRLMSVALTEDAVRERRKTVTRRLGWAAAEPGMPLTLVRKAMGRSRRLPDKTKVVEPLVVVAHVVVVSTRWERLDAITDADVLREGFSHADLADYWHDGSLGCAFVRFFTEHMRCTPATEVNRIEWEYVPVCDSCGQHVVVTTDEVSVNGGWGREVRSAWVEHVTPVLDHQAMLGDLREPDDG